MTTRKQKIRRGLTLVELMITVLAVMILVVGISGILAAGHKNYNIMFKRVNSDVVRNAYEARRTFDRIVRQASVRRCDLLSSGNEIYVYYFSAPNNLGLVFPDRYAKFYLVSNGSDSDLFLDNGVVGANFNDIPPPDIEDLDLTLTSQIKLAGNVVAPTNGIFSINGNSIQMSLILDNEEKDNSGNEIQGLETLKMTVTTMGIRRNDWNYGL